MTKNESFQPIEIRFTHQGHVFSGSVRINKKGRFRAVRPLTKAFVFGPGDDFDSEAAVGPAAKAVAAPSIFTKRGVFPTVDKAWDKFDATIVAAKRAALEACLAEIAEGADMLKLKFSRKAGCSCGCSPGFILSGAPRGMKIYITDETEEEQRKAARETAKAAEAAQRQEAVWS